MTTPSPNLPPEVSLNERDATYLRQAIEWSNTARARGNRPFGAIVVAQSGEVLTQAYNCGSETHDLTAHAETTAVRQLGLKYDRETLRHATLYSSGEPCVMCAGAIFWSGIGRVVFGIDAERLRIFRGEVTEQKDVQLSCRDVFNASPHPIDCIGPALIEESTTPHVGAWKT
jgi:tRNA(adenine34) deaminase